MKIIRVLLNFVNFTDTNLLAFCLRVVAALTGNTNYPVTSPTLAEITALTNEYSTALSNAANGGKTLTAIKNEKRAEIEIVFRNLALFIQANGQNNLSRILSSGFDANTGNYNTWPLPYTPEGLKFDYGAISGTVDAEANPAEYATMYEFRYTEDAYGPDARWIYLPLTTRPKTTITGITPGKSIWGQVRSINGKGASDWSDPATIDFVR